jgi:hypothetical protein
VIAGRLVGMQLAETVGWVRRDRVAVNGAEGCVFSHPTEK